MGWEYFARWVLFGMMHWLLVPFMLDDLVHRRKVFGGHKWVWAILIIFVLIMGSVIYLLFHPQVFFGDDSDRN